MSHKTRVEHLSKMGWENIRSRHEQYRRLADKSTYEPEDFPLIQAAMCWLVGEIYLKAAESAELEEHTT